MNAKRIIIVGVGMMAIAWTAHAAWLDGWNNRREIIIKAGQVDADLTDFPVVVRLESVGFEFSQARLDGLDVRFTAADGTTQLEFERELHDAESRSGVYWVKVPFVSAATDTRFYVYYGNRSAENAANPAAVWDSDYYAVWHMNETNGMTQADATSNGNDLTQWPGFDLGHVAISDCDSLENWSVSGDNASFSWDFFEKDENVDSATSIKMTVSTVAVGQTNALVYNLSEPIAVGDRAVNFYFNDSVHSPHCSDFSVYVYDTDGNGRCQTFKGAWHPNSWRKFSVWVGRGGTIIGSEPDMDQIERIVFEFVSATTSAYSVNIDSLFGNGGLHEGQTAAIGSGVEFYGYNNALRKASPGISTENLTLSAWVRPDDAETPHNPDGHRQYFLSVSGGNWTPFWQTVTVHGV